MDKYNYKIGKECTDPELAAEFVEVCGKDFTDFLLYHNKEVEHLEYFLHHSQKRKIGMCLDGDYRCPVSRSLFRGKYRHSIPLIKYGKMRQPLNDEDMKYHVKEFSYWSEIGLSWIKCNQRYSGEPELYCESLSCVRKWLFFLYFSVIWQEMMLHHFTQFGIAITESYDLGILALRLLWRSIPEAYLTLSEIQSACDPEFDQNFYNLTVDHVYTVYRTKIVDGGNQGLDEEGPRPLQHLARCKVRERLAANCALPDGIQLLGLPQSIQGYLRLES